MSKKLENDEDLFTSLGRPDDRPSLVNIGIELGSTVLFRTMAEFRAAYETRLSAEGPIYYGRYGTHASRKLEHALCVLEGASGVTLTSSGVSAIACSLQHFAYPGAHLLVADNVYGNTRAFCEGVLARQGVNVEFFSPQDVEAMAEAIRPATCAVMFEAPGSVTFEVPNIPRIARACRAAGVPSILDSTWASPVFLKAIRLGVDVVVYSGTKYLCGHSDAMLGVIAAGAGYHIPLRRTVAAYGEKPGAQEIFLALRGLRTMRMRLETVDKSARTIAKWLVQHPKVKLVLHPALPDCPGHEFWERDFTGAAGLFAIGLVPCDPAEVDAFVDRLKLFGIGVSWGGFESIALPMTPKRTVKGWPVDLPLVRLAVGFETTKSLIRDLDQSLALLSVSRQE